MLFLLYSSFQGLALANDLKKGDEGKIQVIDLGTREIMLSLDINPATHFARFFPSGEVIIFAVHNQICLAGLKTGEIARKFRGHSESVTGIEFIEEGRNFISCSSDGKLCLWECSSGEEVSTWDDDWSPRGNI